jgi:putative membrane protein
VDTGGRHRATPRSRRGRRLSPADPLARDPRVALAEERTLLAWIRTGVALMGFGFVVARFGVFLHELGTPLATGTPQRSGISVWIGAGLVAVGVAVNVAAAAQHTRRLRSLGRGELFIPGPVFGVTVSLVLATIGFGMAVYLVALAR